MSPLNIPTVQVFDPQTGQPLNVNESDVPAMAAQGKVTFQKGQRVPVLDSSGVPGSVASEDAQKAFQQGYKVQPFQQREEGAIEDQYGDLAHEGLAGLAGAARGISFGLSDVALTKSGQVDPDTLKYLQQANPGASLAGEIAGGVLPALLTGGDSAVAEIAGLTPAAGIMKAGHVVSEAASGLLGGSAADSLASRIAKAAIVKGAGSAVEGGMFAAGHDVSEAAIGDPDEVAHHAMADIGMGALVGGLFGVGVEGAKAGLGKFIPRRATQAATESSLTSQISQDAQAAGQGQQTPTPLSTAQDASPYPDAVTSQTPVQAPQSIEEIQQAVANAKASGVNIDRPEAKVLLSAEAALAGEVKYPITELQVRSMQDPALYDDYQARKISGTPVGDALNQYEALQKQESVELLNKTIKGMSPSGDVTADATDAGNKVIDGFSDQYEKEQAELGPKFKKFSADAPGVKVSSSDIVNSVSKSIPNFESYVDVSPDLNKVTLKPYSARMKITPDVYTALKSAVEAANEDGLTVDDVWNIRKNVTAKLNKMSDSYGSDASTLSGVKKNLMDLMMDKVNDPDLRNTFKRFAINEENRGTMERVFGGSISDRASMLKQITPEKVLDKVFGSSVTIKAAKSILPEEVFNEARANYLARQVDKVTDKGAFRSQPFASWLKKNSDKLGEAFSDAQEPMQKVSALADRMRILPDAPSINPSGTAKASALLKTIIGAGKVVQHPVESVGKGLEWLGNRLDNRAQIDRLNEALSGTNSRLDGIAGKLEAQDSLSQKETQYGVLKRLEDASKRSSKTITNSVEDFFKNNKAASVAIPAAALSISQNSSRKSPYHHLIDQSTQIQSNPGGMVDHMGTETSDMRQYAPGVADSMASLGTNAAAFLSSKAPKNPYVGNSLTPQVHDWKPSSVETAKFKRYADAVYHPLSVLNHLNNNTLSNEEVETLQSVYPKIYQNICAEAANQMTEMKKPLPYSKRLTISKLLGVPYESTMQPQMIQALQAAHQSSQAQDGANGIPNNSSGMKQTGLSKINKSQNLMTDTQRVQTRGNS